MVTGSGVARSQIVLNYGVLAPLCDPILDRVPTYRATQQVAALHEVIEGYTDIQFANVAPARTSPTRCGAFTARQRACADSMSLNAMAMPAAREPGPLVTR